MREIRGFSGKTAASSEAMQTGASEPCVAFPSQRPVEDEQLQHKQQSTDAGPTFTITLMHAMSGDTIPLEIPFTDSLCRLSHRIALRLGARSCDLTIMFQSRLVGDDDCEKNVIDFGLRAGSVLEVVRLVRHVKLVVFVNYMDDLFEPRRRATFSFQMVVPRNSPCAALVKTEVMQRFDGERYDCVQKLTNPHLFLLNYGFDQIRNSHSMVFSLGDELCLDDFPGQQANPYEVYVIDQQQCQCETCDLAWMLNGWYCPRIWNRTFHADGRCRSATALALLELQTRGAAHFHGRCRSANAPSSSSSDGDAS